MCSGIAQACLVGPSAETWGAIGIVGYPRLAVFEHLITDAVDVAPHRLAALVDWRLYTTGTLA